MRNKIIGVTVGSPLPKPNLKQTDPKKGDFVHGRDIIPTKVSQLENDAKYVTEKQLSSLSAEKLDKDAVFGWAKAEQFDIANLANCNFTAREGYARYKDNSAYFVYTMPNPQPGVVTVTLRFERDAAHAGKYTDFFFKYADGTQTRFQNAAPDTVHTFVSDADKTAVEFTGGNNFEQYVYLDLSVMSMIADYAAPTGGGSTAKVMTGATANAAGKSGLVPAPAAGDQDKVLHGDGTWREPPANNSGNKTGYLPLVAELILTEEASSVELSVDLNGNPLSLTEMQVKFSIIGGDNNGEATSNRSNAIWYLNGINTAVQRRTVNDVVPNKGATLALIFHAKKCEYGFLLIDRETQSGTPVRLDHSYFDGGEQGLRGGGNAKYTDFNKITVYTATEGKTFGVGSCLQIFGR